jgi:hypothetical protein
MPIAGGVDRLPLHRGQRQCLVEHQSSADLSLTLAIAREVGNSLLTDSLLAES